jgi:Response regulator containing CheY-like receiver, AAA-type ATPase, and DNA-binding domains
MSNILIVDDSTDLLEALEYFLTEKGYNVKCVATTEDLLPLIRSFLPDLVLLDIFLQGEDGREVCKKLRQNRETKYLCIMLFSASGKLVKDYEKCGADGYIEKPFGLNELLTKIESTIDHCKDFYPPHVA